MKRFEEAKDNVKSILGEEFSQVFTVNADTHKKACEGDKKEALVDGSWSCWTAHVQLRNSDGNKHGSLKNQLNNQCTLVNGQWTQDNAKMTDVVINHKWDKKCHAMDKKTQDKKRESPGK